MVRHYTLSSEDLALINRRRGEPNRFGFALMLCYLRFPGRILQQGEEPPVERICSAPSIICATKGMIRYPVISPIYRLSAGSTSI